jgi:hypothetical protein
MAILPPFDQWAISILVPGILQLLVMQFTEGDLYRYGVIAS